LHKKHVSEKETWRWVEGYNKATELARQCPDTHVLSISDREGDFYDLFERAEQTPGIKADWLVRMKFNNRATLNINGKRDHRLLHERIMEITPQQLVEFTIPDGRGQQARTLPDMLSSDAGPLSYPLIYSSKVMIISLFDSTVMPDKYRHNGK
ncbi:IS4/Tn5 family transposase DNA-binding protein, partial [Shigella sp. SIG2]